MKIVVTHDQDFTEEQKKRLESLGDVTYYDSLPNKEEYLERIKGADIICSGTAGLKDAYPYLKDIYVTTSFVSVAFVDLDVLKKNNVRMSNAPGVNKYAVSEWVMTMATLLVRDLLTTINREETYRKNGGLPPTMLGLAGKKMTILGQGNIGKQVGKLATAYDMEVNYFKRDDDLKKAVKDADIVVSTLSSNPSTIKLLDEEFFKTMKVGSYFINSSRSEIIDESAMLRSLDDGHLNGMASDCGDILVGDTEDPIYRKLLSHPKALVTPHIAYNTDMSIKMGLDVMIDNVEAWIKGKPQNLVN